MLEERDARIAVLEERERVLLAALNATADALSTLAGLGVPNAVSSGSKKLVARLLNESIANARRAAAAYPAHSEG